jgi:potassium efflux system protein
LPAESGQAEVDTLSLSRKAQRIDNCSTEGGRAMIAMSVRTLGYLGCLLAFSLAAIAAETTPAQPADLAAALQESAENIRRLEQQLASQPEPGSAISASLFDELALWRQIELVANQRAAISQTGQAAVPSPAAPKSTGSKIARFAELEEARDALVVTENNLASLLLELQAERSLMLQTKDLMQRAEQERRLTNEDLLSVSADSRQVLQIQQRRQTLRVQLHGQQYALHRETIAELTRRQDQIESIIGGYRTRIERAGTRVLLSDSELKLQLGRIGEMEITIRRQLSELDQQQHRLLVQTSQQGDTTVSAQLEMIREESQLLRQLLTEMGAIRECWKRRYLFSHQRASEEQRIAWRDESRQAEDRLAQIHDRLSGRMIQRRQQAASIRRGSTGDDPQRMNRAAEIAQFEAMLDAYGNLQVLAARGQRLYARFADDLEAGHRTYSFGRWTSRAVNFLYQGWNYELTAVDDRSITVGKLVTAFLLLIVGVIISKVGSAIFAFGILPRFGFSQDAAMTIRQMMMYALIVAMTMLALNMAHVPLTIFAYLGGAAAIGVGFGSQNTIANFISGLILLIQRPIRIGDLINVDGIDANVEHIGARATRVRTTENLEVLVPNSNLLHNNVTNWTLSDTKIRTCVSVGVAYGSPVRTVADTLEQVVTAHSKVMDHPDPIVLFEEFGDSSLVFKVHFWIHMRKIMDGEVVRSDIRMAIDDAFRQAGIVIAFPQQDVHLDLHSPIEIALADKQQSISRPTRRAA